MSKKITISGLLNGETLIRRGKVLLQGKRWWTGWRKPRFGLKFR